MLRMYAESITWQTQTQRTTRDGHVDLKKYSLVTLTQCSVQHYNCKG